MVELTFGEWLKVMRLRSKKSLTQVGQDIGRAGSTVSRWEKNLISYKQLSIEEMEAYCISLGVSFEDFVQHGGGDGR